MEEEIMLMLVFFGLQFLIVVIMGITYFILGFGNDDHNRPVMVLNQ